MCASFAQQSVNTNFVFYLVGLFFAIIIRSPSLSMSIIHWRFAYYYAWIYSLSAMLFNESVANSQVVISITSIKITCEIFLLCVFFFRAAIHMNHVNDCLCVCTPRTWFNYILNEYMLSLCKRHSILWYLLWSSHCAITLNNAFGCMWQPSHNHLQMVFPLRCTYFDVQRCLCEYVFHHMYMNILFIWRCIRPFWIGANKTTDTTFCRSNDI